MKLMQENYKKKVKGLQNYIYELVSPESHQR